MILLSPTSRSNSFFRHIQEDVDEFMKKSGHDTAESVLKDLDEQHQKYKFMELNLLARKRRWVHLLDQSLLTIKNNNNDYFLPLAVFLSVGLGKYLKQKLIEMSVTRLCYKEHWREPRSLNLLNLGCPAYDCGVSSKFHSFGVQLPCTHVILADSRATGMLVLC